MRGDPDVLDPRPRFLTASGRVVGRRCAACGHVTVHPRVRCPECGDRLESTSFGPVGQVWSSTVVRIPIPEREPPFALVYVDLDDGPRLLAHVQRDGEAIAPPIGSRVRVVGMTNTGDIEVEPS